MIEDPVCDAFVVIQPVSAFRGPCSVIGMERSNGDG